MCDLQMVLNLNGYAYDLLLIVNLIHIIVRGRLSRNGYSRRLANELRVGVLFSIK